MDLLSGYVDSDEEEEEQADAPAPAPAGHGESAAAGAAAAGDAGSDAGGVIPGFESYKQHSAPASRNDSPAVSVSGASERLRGGITHGAAGDPDGTPGAARPRHHRFKVISKSSTPVIHGSPGLHQSMPSDESTPNSPARRSALAPAPPPPEVVLPEKPDGEVEQALAGRVEKYMSMRGKREPVYVNKVCLWL